MGGLDRGELPDELPKGNDPAAVAAVMARLASRRRWVTRLEAARIFSAWPEIAGDAVAANAEPVRLHGGVLVVRAASPAWATQLRYFVPDLVARANAVLGEGTVSSVTITTGTEKDRRARR